jgi:hypothetical protein
MNSIVPFNEFNGSDVTAGKLNTLDNGGKVVYLSLNEKPVVVQTPSSMFAPYGLSKWDNDGKGPAKYTLDLSFKGMDTRDMLKQFHKSLQDFDQTIGKAGLANADVWFKSNKSTKFTQEIIDMLYTSVLRRSKDDKYPPTFKMTVPYDNSTNEFRCKVFDKKTREPLNMNEVNFKGAKVTAIIQCTGIWIAGGKFGTTWKAIQLLVEQNAKISEFAFREIEGDKADDLAEEEDEEDAEEVIKEAPVNTAATEDDFVDSEEEDELEKKPSKVVKKAVVAKKK